MSGSPIISEGSYIGLYVRGLVLPGQKELIDMIKFIGSKGTQAFCNLMCTCEE